MLGCDLYLENKKNKEIGQQSIKTGVGNKREKETQNEKRQLRM